MTSPQQTVLPKISKLTLIALAMALFSSGASGLINQVVWQRSLKVFLGGSETICSTVVVLVFMAGLGFGSVWMSRFVSRLRSPLRTLGAVEIGLACVNLVVCLILRSDLTSSVFQIQRAAVAFGLPLLGVYAVLALAVLAIPCLLMGATMPLAAEAMNRDLGIKNSRLLGTLFAINTVGSVVGTIVSGGWMMANLGLSLSMGAAVGLNLLAGVCILVSARRYPATEPKPTEDIEPIKAAAKARRSWKPSRNEVLGFGLGFCSLAFEMFLFRVVPLRHEPLPFTFSAVLGGFLLFWSIGAALSSRGRGISVQAGIGLCAASCIMTLVMYLGDAIIEMDGTWSLLTFILFRSPYFLPCVLFGYLFGRVASDAAKSWGTDIGRFYGWNTAGACLGVLFTTFVGYELPFFALIVVIGLLTYSLQPVAGSDRVTTPSWLVPSGVAAALCIGCLCFDVSHIVPGQAMYSGRDGVVVISNDRSLIWDGLWHSALSENDDHIGTNNWCLATAPVWCHMDTEIKDVCVIGVGTGITASTLAKLPAVESVDAYDISSVLDEVFENHAAGCLHVRDNERINLILQDARTGLALNPKKYDVIQTQPLYLKQSGSALLNSIEFLQLVKTRLNKNGVLCVFANGTPEQAFVLRETADAVFPYRESFFNGYLLVVSNDPITVAPEALQAKLQQDDPFWAEVRGNAMTATASKIMTLMDQPRLPSGDGNLVVTDDQPVIEYPHYLTRQINKQRYSFQLPLPISANALRGSK